MGVTVFCRRRTLLTTVHRGMVCQWWDRWLTITTVIWTIIIIDCIIDIIIITATVKTISTSCWTAMKKNSIY
jgi:hypothetical protein